jgi:hypothetical protein
MEMKQKAKKWASRSSFPIASTALAALLGSRWWGSHQPCRRRQLTAAQNPYVVLPLVNCWYKGNVPYYIQTDASDEAFAKQQDVNYVPQLSNAIASGAVDDIYHVTNSGRGT